MFRSFPGTACAIPAIMSTRNIENVKERLITILITPFMTCSARLPVYSINCRLIFTDGTFFGVKYKAIALGNVFLRICDFAFSRIYFKYFIKNKGKTFLVMDLPTYKMPLWKYDFKLVLGKVEIYYRCWKNILAVSVILWF